MATTYSNRYVANSTVPTSGRPLSKNTGPNPDWVEASYATTDIDAADEIKYLLAVQCGKEIVYLDISETTDMDSNGAPTLDMDLYLRTTDKDGNHTDTSLFNAGTFFQAAQTTGAVRRIWCTTKVPNSAVGYGHIISKTVTEAATAVAGTFNLYAQVH
jgi:hypothetical protein